MLLGGVPNVFGETAKKRQLWMNGQEELHSYELPKRNSYEGTDKEGRTRGKRVIHVVWCNNIVPFAL